MLCQQCQEKEATFFLTQVVNGVTGECHLCSQCAHDKGMIDHLTLGVSNILAGLPFLVEETTDQGDDCCPSCGTSWSTMEKKMRPGCKECYHHFKDHWIPWIQKIQGSAKHVGQVPHLVLSRKRKEKYHSHKKALEASLQSAVENQEYYLAASLKKQLQELELPQQNGFECSLSESVEYNSNSESKEARLSCKPTTLNMPLHDSQLVGSSSNEPLSPEPPFSGNPAVESSLEIADMEVPSPSQALPLELPLEFPLDCSSPLSYPTSLVKEEEVVEKEERQLL